MVVSILFYTVIACMKALREDRITSQEMPVSYTHLDVYKRQFEHSVHGFAVALRFRPTGQHGQSVLDVVQGESCLLYTSRCV